MAQQAKIGNTSLILALLTLSVALGLHYFYNIENTDHSASANKVRSKLYAELQVSEEELKEMIEELRSGRTVDFDKVSIKTKYPFYVFQSGELLFWSDHHHVPPYKQVSGDYHYKYVSQTERKKYVTRKWQFDRNGRKIELISLIPLRREYEIVNAYIQPNYNSAIFSNDSFELLRIKDEMKTANPIFPICIGRKKACLFSIVFADDYRESDLFTSRLVFFLFLLSIILFVVFSFDGIRTVTEKYGVNIGFLTLISGVLLFRYATLYFNFPNSIVNFDLFSNPNHFAASETNKSLGDLLVNVSLLLVVVFYLFIYYPKAKWFRLLERSSYPWRLILSSLLVGLAFSSLFYQYVVFQTVYHNSLETTTYDLTNTIRFSLVRWVCYLIFVIDAMIFFLFFHIVYQLVVKVNARYRRDLILSFSLGLIAFAMVNLYNGQEVSLVVIIGALYGLVIHLLRLPRHLVQLKYTALIYFFVAAISSSLLGALAIKKFEQERAHNNKEIFAEKFLTGDDFYVKYLLNIAMGKIKKDPFIEKQFQNPLNSKEAVKKKVRKVFLSNYLDSYNINIALADANFRAFRSDEQTGLHQEIRGIIKLEENRTDAENLYFIDQKGTDALSQYIGVVEIKRKSVIIGYVILDVKLKKIIPDNVYPKLLVNESLSKYFDNNYSYAVFKQGKISYNYGDFNYTKDFDSDVLKLQSGEDFVLNGYRHTVIMDKQDGKVTVVSSKVYPFVNVISNFSFLLLLLTFSTIFLLGAYTLYFGFFADGLNYSAKIQLYLNLAFFLPLISVSITTLSLINSSFKEEVNHEHSKQAASINKNIAEDLEDYLRRGNRSNDELKIYFAEVAGYAGADANLFNVDGELIATTQPAIYDREVLSSYANPVAMKAILEDAQDRITLKESGGKLSFNVNYLAVKSPDTRELLGIMSVPFFESEHQIEEQQIKIFTNVLNIFTIIFLIFLLISYFASKWLTFPLKFITLKLKKTTLSSFNEPLNWNSDDEIGIMVREYNRMVVNLEDSKKALARSEKESAWREMAQQVAHEIKNPLTPMKLTLQHLSRILKRGDDLSVVERPINTLLHQVDTLSDIATSFSTFAKMPIPAHERYDLAAVLRKVAVLYTSSGDATLSVDIPDGELHTKGDEQLMGRIITNLILNAQQSKDSERDLRIKVKLQNINNRKLLVSVEDNGKGIDEHIQEKVFLPKFTTKETGSGIGLAIAKHGIEHAGGKIWFDTVYGEGTTFYIEQPLVG